MQLGELGKLPLNEANFVLLGFSCLKGSNDERTTCCTAARATCSLLVNARTQFKCSLSLRGFMPLCELKENRRFTYKGVLNLKACVLAHKVPQKLDSVPVT